MPNRGRKHLLAEVRVVRFRQHVDQHVAIEDVDAHARQQVASFAFNAVRVDPSRVGMIFNQSCVFGFSRKPCTRPSSSSRIIPKPAACLASTGNAAIVTSAFDFLCVSSISL